MSVMIVYLCFLYLDFVSIFCLLFFVLCICLWNIAYMGRWSDSGGDIVPEVISVSVFVVSITSISDDDLWKPSYRVGVVIVVCKSLSCRKVMKAPSGVSAFKFMFMSPCIVMHVVGCFVCIRSIVA